MSVKKVLLYISTALVFTSCHSYEVMKYKADQLDKVGDIAKYNVYVHSKSGTFKVDKPSISPAGLTGTPSHITDAATITEIKEPTTKHQMKKHLHDLNIYTHTVFNDSAQHNLLNKRDITEVTRVMPKKGTNFGNIVADILGTAVCLAFLSALVYWFSLI